MMSSRGPHVNDMPPQPDFLGEIDAERTAAKPDFPRILAAARERRALIAQLAAKRRELHIPQAEVARRITTSRPSCPVSSQARSIRSTPPRTAMQPPSGSRSSGAWCRRDSR